MNIFKSTINNRKYLDIMLDPNKRVYFTNEEKFHIVLDIGSDSLKVMLGCISFRGFELRGLWEESYRDNEFDLNASSEKRVLYLRTALGKAIPPSTMFCPKSFSIILPSSAVFIQPTTLPPVRGRIARQSVEFEVKEKIPCSLEELVWDYMDLSPKEKGPRNVILAAARRQIVEDCFSAAKAFGKIEHISIGPVLIYEALRKRLKPTECLLVLDIGSRMLDVIVVSKKDFWSRTLTSAASRFMQSAAEAAGMSEVDLEIKLCKEGIGANGFSEIVQTKLSELIAEVERTIAIFRQEVQGISFSGLLILGGLTCIKGIESSFSEAFDLPLLDLSTFVPGPRDSGLSSPKFFKVGSFAAIDGRSLNLIPREEREGRRKSKLKYLFSSIGLTLAVLLMFPLAFVFVESQKIRHESFSIEEKIKTFNSYKQQIETVRKKMEPWQKFMEDAQKSLVEKDLIVRIFKELERVLPQSFWLEEIQYETGSHKLVLEGNMRERLSDVARLEEGFKRSGLFGKVEVNQGYVQPDGTRRFSCVVEVKP